MRGKPEHGDSSNDVGNFGFLAGHDPTVRELFHTLRIEGNKATHQFRTQHREAIRGLKAARGLEVWFHRAFADPDFKAGAFKPPQDPSRELRELQTEMERLTDESRVHQAALEKREREFHERLAEQARSQAEGEPGQVSRPRLRQANRALNDQLGMVEVLTRLLIDQQLQEAGWEADSLELTWRRACAPRRWKAPGTAPPTRKLPPASSAISAAPPWARR